MLLEAFDSNWIAPFGPHVDAFEKEFAEVVDVDYALAVVSGTAALHLALMAHGIGPGDGVLVPTLTFVATANAVRYLGGVPVLVDVDPDTWTIDCGLVEDCLSAPRPADPPVRAAIGVDLYGQCADYRALQGICGEAGVALIEDAAEALGATYEGHPAGSLASAGIFSFNGNKVITTSGGGMLVTNDHRIAARARHLSNQAKLPAPHYEHDEVGYNYRLSNLLCALGRGQLAGLASKVSRRREICDLYRSYLGGLPGLSFMPEAGYGTSSRWLTVMLVDAAEFGCRRDELVVRLAAFDVEARPTWKPMHRQPAYAQCPAVGGRVADHIFERGICLPSGSSMSDGEVARVAEVVAASVRP